ncbi:unnamed protein product, partial [Mesorhabditis spiculigera]
MHIFRRFHVAIPALFGPFGLWIRRGIYYFRRSHWVAPGIRPYQLCLWPAGASYSPADYLDIYMHALPKLRTVPRLRLNQMYHEKSDCLGSLTVIEQLIREIVKKTQSSAPRQVIEFRTLRYLDEVSQEDLAEYQREMDMYVVDSVGSARSRLPGRGTTVWATGIRIILALNDPEEHAQRLIEQVSLD